MVTMSNTFTLSSLPTGVLVLLGLVLVLEIVLDVIALVDLYRRPIERVALGNKWVWVVVIVLVNLIGSILYLAVGRKSAALADDGGSPQAKAHTNANIADALYGPRDDTKES